MTERAAVGAGALLWLVGCVLTVTRLGALLAIGVFGWVIPAVVLAVVGFVEMRQPLEVAGQVIALPDGDRVDERDDVHAGPDRRGALVG